MLEKWKKWSICLLICSSSQSYSLTRGVKFGFGGCGTGLAVGYAIASSVENGQLISTVAANTAIGCVVGLAVGAYLGEPPSQKETLLKRELAVFRSAAVSQQKFAVTSYDFSKTGNMPPHLEEDLTCGRNQVFQFCPKGEGGLGSCREPRVSIMNNNWGAQCIFYLSPSGCFEPKSFTPIPGLTNYLNSELGSIIDDIEREVDHER